MVCVYVAMVCVYATVVCVAMVCVYVAMVCVYATVVALFPGPHPAFRRFRTTSDGKLGGGLETRLLLWCMLP